MYADHFRSGNKFAKAVELHAKPLRLATRILVTCVLLTGCGVPRYNVKYDSYGPDTQTIVQRITCELAEMIKKDPATNQRAAPGAFLVTGNYVAAMKLSLKVTDTGELAPSLDFPSVTSTLAIGAKLNLTNKRAHTTFKYLSFSIERLQRLIEKDPDYGSCPSKAYSNLEGKLGIQDMVWANFSSPSSFTVDGPLGSSGGLPSSKAEFGGTVEFTVTRNINSAGPTWALSDFKGPGGLAKLDRTSVNTLTIAFAPGPEEEGVLPTPADFSDARKILEIELISQRLN